MVTDHYSPLLQPEGSHRHTSKNEQDCVTIKLYLWSPEFELHIIFMCYKIFLFVWFFFHSFKNVKHYPNFWAVQKLDSSYVWPMAEACWSWTKLSIKHEGRTSHRQCGCGPQGGLRRSLSLCLGFQVSPNKKSWGSVAPRSPWKNLKIAIFYYPAPSPHHTHTLALLTQKNYAALWLQNLPYSSSLQIFGLTNNAILSL